MKPCGVEIPAHRHRDSIAQAQVLLHRQTAQIEEAILQPHLLGQRLVVHLEWRWKRRVQDFDLVGEDLDLARNEVRIDRALGARAHPARHLHYELAAQLFGGPEGVRPIRVAHHLHQPLAIAQVDEDHATVVAPAMHPAA